MRGLIIGRGIKISYSSSSAMSGFCMCTISKSPESFLNLNRCKSFLNAKKGIYMSFLIMYIPFARRTAQLVMYQIRTAS